MKTDRCDRRPRGLHRECGAKLDLRVDRLGRLVATCPRCSRQAKGLCRDCERRTDAPRALYCPSCRAMHRQLANRRQLADPQKREQKNAAWRKRWRADAAYRARKRLTRKAWMAARPGKKKEYAHRYQNGASRPLYLAAMRAANERRRDAARAWARKRYYELHPQRPQPVCDCGATIAYTGKGRPKTRCDGCVPPSVAAKRKQPSRIAA